MGYKYSEKRRLAGLGNTYALGYKQTEEHKEKIRLANTGKKLPEEAKEKMRLAALGFKHSVEAKEKMSLAKKGKPSFFKGKTLSEESRKKIGDIHRGKIWTDEKKENLKTYWKNLSYEEKIKRTEKARLKCRANPSSIEIAISLVLEELEIEFASQKLIGAYIVDFYLPNRNLVIECDGDYWHGSDRAKEHDKKKDLFLESKGYKVLRLRECDINKDAKAVFLKGFGELCIE